MYVSVTAWYVCSLIARFESEWIRLPGSSQYPLIILKVHFGTPYSARKLEGKPNISPQKSTQKFTMRTQYC